MCFTTNKAFFHLISTTIQLSRDCYFILPRRKLRSYWLKSHCSCAEPGLSPAFLASGPPFTPTDLLPVRKVLGAVAAICFSAHRPFRGGLQWDRSSGERLWPALAHTMSWWQEWCHRGCWNSGSWLSDDISPAHSAKSIGSRASRERLCSLLGAATGHTSQAAEHLKGPWV